MIATWEVPSHGLLAPVAYYRVTLKNDDRVVQSALISTPKYTFLNADIKPCTIHRVFVKAYARRENTIITSQGIGVTYQKGE